MKKIDFSIIVLNSNSNYLLSCINSIVKQEYPKDKVEIILMTEPLDKEVKQTINNLEFNIIVKEKKGYDNITLYNTALKHATGKYINFINSDIEYIDTNTLSKVNEALTKNDIVITKMNILNPLTNKQKGYLLANNNDEIVELYKNPQMINLCLESYFINKKILKGIQFDKNFVTEYREKFISELYYNKEKYYNLGSINLLSYTVYEDDKSNRMQYNALWYDQSIINWTKYLKQQKAIPNYIQEIIMYLIYIKFKYNMNSESKHESEKLFRYIKEILQYINSKNIFNNEKRKYMIPRTVEQFLYSLKENTSNILPIDLEQEKINIYAINYKNGRLVIDADVDLMDYIKEEEFLINIKYGNEKITTKRNHIYSLTKAFNKIINEKYTFQFEVDITSKYDNLTATYTYQDKEYELKFNFVRLQSRLDNLKGAYWSHKKFTIENHINYLSISKKKIIHNFKLECQYLINKLRKEKNKKRMLKLICLRILYQVTKSYYKNKHIWITYDKLYKAGDNGEYVYQYGIKHNKNIYYIIKKDSADYNRLISDPNNKVIVFNTLKAKLYCLHAEVILKTHAGIMGFCGFDGIARPFIRGLLNAEIIEIQHGLTIQDIPEYQNRLADNIKLYCIASPFEKTNIMQDIYGYQEEQIKSTGISRYDGLKNDDKRIILITPTWRHNLASPSLSHGTQRAYNNAFKESDYYKIYNTLINHPKLIESAKNNNYRIIYLIHPTLATQIDDFDKNEYVDIIAAGGDMSYEKILKESSLMVTDYSGVQYDFAYMRKSLIYFHPDELPPHYNNGSIDYIKNGFGPIVEDSETLVNSLIELMERDCKNEKMYIKRADEFFFYNDFNSSKRVIEEVETYLKENE